MSLNDVETNPYLIICGGCSDTNVHMYFSLPIQRGRRDGRGSLRMGQRETPITYIVYHCKTKYRGLLVFLLVLKYPRTSR